MLNVSYILPCYNTEKYISQCIESLYRQNMPENEFEVICVNNATTDNLENIVLEFQKKHMNIQYVKLNVNVCSGGAYNAGLKVAQGKYIQFVDSDDYLKDGIENKLLTEMVRFDLDLLYFNIASFKDLDSFTLEQNLRFNGNLNNEIDICDGSGFVEYFIKQKSFEFIPVPAYRKLIKKDFLVDNKIEFTETTVGTDFLHNLICLKHAQRVKGICFDPYCFRYNPNGVTRSAITPAKIIFALNNYGEAYRQSVDSNFNEDVKKVVYAEMARTVSMYMSYVSQIPNNEKKIVYKSIENIDVIKILSRDLLSKLIVKHPYAFMAISRLSPFFVRKLLVRLKNVYR